MENLFFENVLHTQLNHIAIRYIVAICKTQMMIELITIEIDGIPILLKIFIIYFLPTLFLTFSSPLRDGAFNTPSPHVSVCDS